MNGVLPLAYIDVRSLDPKNCEELESYDVGKVRVRILRDKKSGFVVYYAEEPYLTDEEKEILKEVKKRILEDLPDPDEVVEYAQKIIKKIMKKKKKKLPEESIEKILYYVERDHVKYGKMTVLLEDPNIEDIQIVGIGKPIFVWHRRYEYVPTNIIIENEDEELRYTSMLAIKSGKHVSLSRPIVDGRLPDGSRIHIVHNSVARGGMSITIRKHKTIPYTIVDLIRMKTIPAKAVAYLWVLLENKKSILVIGETAAGKSFPKDTIIPVRVNGIVRLVTAEELYNMVSSEEYKIDDHLVKDVDGIEVLGVDNYKLRWMKLKKVIRHKDTRPLVRVRTDSSIIVTTRDHNFVKIDPETLEPIAVKAENLSVGDVIVNTMLDTEFNTDTKIEPEYAYLLGLWIGDGTVDTKRGYIEFVNSEEELIERFEKLAKKYWHGSIYLIKDKRNGAKYLRVKSQKALADVSRLISPQGKKAFTVRVPDEVLFSSKEVCKAFIGGILDTDGSIMIREKERKRVTIEFTTKSLALANGISFILKRLRILHTLKMKTVRGTPHYRIMIHDVYAKKLLDMLHNWSCKAKRYRDIVAEIVDTKKCSLNITMFPIGSFLKKIRTALGLPERIVEEELGISERYIYEKGARRISPENLRRLYEYYKKKAIEMKRSDVIEMIEKLEKLLDGDLVAEEVLAVEEIKPTTEWLYDLEVEGTHLFVIGQIGWRLNHNTTLLNALAMLIPLNMKISVVEETPELNLPHQNITYMMTKEGVDHIGGVDLFNLVKAAMRQRPDYVIVGEIRGEEAYVLFQAMSLGHGGLSTLHAGSPEAAIKRLMSDPMNIPPYMIKVLGALVHITKIRFKRHGMVMRRVLSITEIRDIDPATKEPDLIYVYKHLPDPENPKDIYNFEESLALKSIANNRGRPVQYYYEIIEKRTRFLEKLAKEKLSYNEVLRRITAYED